MKYIEVVTRVIIKRGSKILLCKNKEHGIFYLPGGHVEFGDTMHKTVYKEFGEEMGIQKSDIHNLTYRETLEQIYGEPENLSHEYNLIFTADLPEDMDVKSEEDPIDFEWQEISDLENIKFRPQIMVPKVRQFTM